MVILMIWSTKWSRSIIFIAQAQKYEGIIWKDLLIGDIIFTIKIDNLIDNFYFFT